MSREVGFSIADDIKDFVDYYADMRLTTPSAMAKKGMVAEMKRHPLQRDEMEEYEKSHGPIPQACLTPRSRTGTVLYSSSLNSLKNQESLEDKTKDKETYAEGVTMLKAEYSALCAKYGQATIDLAIQKVAAQQIKVGKAYKSARGAILQWGIRAALEELKKAGTGIKREAPPAPVCDVCGKPCERDHGYWSCATDGRRENVG